MTIEAVPGGVTKTVNTVFGKRRLFCGCEYRLTQKRSIFLSKLMITRSVSYPLDLKVCSKCHLFPWVFKNSGDAKKFKEMYDES